MGHLKTLKSTYPQSNPEYPIGGGYAPQIWVPLTLVDFDKNAVDMSPGPDTQHQIDRLIALS